MAWQLNSQIQEPFLQWQDAPVVKYRSYGFSVWAAQRRNTGTLSSAAGHASSQDLLLQWLGSSAVKYRNFFISGRQLCSLIQDLLLLWLGGSVFKYRSLFLQWPDGSVVCYRIFYFSGLVVQWSITGTFSSAARWLKPGFLVSMRAGDLATNF